MRLLLFVSVLGILVSIAVLIIVIIKAKKDTDAPKSPKDK